MLENPIRITHRLVENNSRCAFCVSRKPFVRRVWHEIMFHHEDSIVGSQEFGTPIYMCDKHWEESKNKIHTIIDFTE